MNHSVESMPLWLSIPFAVMLLLIAVGPLLFEHWWEKNKNKLLVSLALGIPVAIILIAKGLQIELMHQILFDYIPFIVLLAALFIITGGIHLKGDIKPRPITNTLFLAIGGILASFMGTTGAAMLLIRPVINTISKREHKVHTILFFIAIVANTGGILTPLGDPPLFLLYLRSTPFTWFFTLFNEWIFIMTSLLTIYFLVDTHYYRKEVHDKNELEVLSTKIKIIGKRNFYFLAGVILAVAFLNENYIEAFHHNHYLGFIRESIIVLMAILSLYYTQNEMRYTHNRFTWGPILEVAFLFLGIFITMTPTLIFLKENAQAFNLDQPWQFYYATGSLSAFLDNAPTAVSFHNLAMGMTASFPGAKIVGQIPEVLLRAISVSAVFFGAMTYIGNGPNFMVKAIAEEQKIKMPSFFGYILKFSLVVLLPVYILTQLIFL